VHGQTIAKGEAKAAICADCQQPARRGPNVESFGQAAHRPRPAAGCHAGQRQVYTDTFHGQVTPLGYAYTAQCFNCHGQTTR
jgi:hypothetical protein